MNRYILLIFFTFMLWSDMIGQVSYHRLYTTAEQGDTIYYQLSSTTDRGNPYMMGVRTISANFGFQELVFSSHDNKGDIKWSQMVDVGVDSVEFIGRSDLSMNSTGDTMIYAINAIIDGDSTMFFGKYFKGGESNLSPTDYRMWTVKGNQYATYDGNPLVAPFLDTTDLVLLPGKLPTIFRVKYKTNVLWSRTYAYMDTMGHARDVVVTDMEYSRDSTIVMGGYLRQEPHTFFISKLDSNGVQIWASLYKVDANFGDEEYIFDVEPLSNGSVAWLFTFAADDGGTVFGLVDTSGQVKFSKEIVVKGGPTHGLRIIESQDKNLILAGHYIIDSLDESAYFMSKFSKTGQKIWASTTYKPNLDAISPDLDVFRVNDTGGATMVGMVSKDEDLPVLSVMKHDVDGVAMCSDTVSVTTESVSIDRDTLVSEVENGAVVLTPHNFMVSQYSFLPPVLHINDAYKFCPNEPIDTILVAQAGLDDAVATYKWSTGETNDTIRIMKDGEYSVTVTVTEDVCYILCDTVMVDRYSLPEASINQNNDSYCTEKTVLLPVFVSGGKSPYDIVWSTGQTDNAITVNTEGQYAVTVTDACGEIATASIDVSFPKYNPVVGAGANNNEFCENDGVVITAGNDGFGGPVTYTWSNGEVGNPITVTEAGTYVVTATDECGNVATTNVEVTIPVIADSVQVTTDIACNEEDPKNSTFTVNAIPFPADAEITLWINSSALPNIPSNPLVLNQYLVEVTNICGDVLYHDSLNTEGACGVFLYPLGFFPSGNEDIERSFGPIYPEGFDLTRISDFEFKVFDRWGEEVFSTTNVEEQWDGTHKGSPAPSEVYLWYVSYYIDSMKQLDKGDVTLIR